MTEHYELADCLKKILSIANLDASYEKELATISLANQKELCDVISNELESFLSFFIVINQIKGDANTALGSLYST